MATEIKDFRLNKPQKWTEVIGYDENWLDENVVIIAKFSRPDDAVKFANFYAVSCEYDVVAVR